MIHHLFTLWTDGLPVQEQLATDVTAAIRCYVHDATNGKPPERISLAVWKDGKWFGYFRALYTPTAERITQLPEPGCFDPMPCPKVTPAVTAPAFASCDAAAQQVAFMALESRARSLGLEAEEHRSVGHDEQADILVGQQAACVAALDVLKGVAR